jgi:hypothetical protein
VLIQRLVRGLAIHGVLECYGWIVGEPINARRFVPGLKVRFSDASIRPHRSIENIRENSGLIWRMAYHGRGEVLTMMRNALLQ